MSYQVLARKYRSKNFDELIGQDHVSRTLINSIKNNRLPHALLFTGLRGTGKTSTARILAKILRCENLVEFKPCNTCSSCLEIASGSSVDVLEIDGASNNGVDSVRDLRETVMFSPSKGKYKILIIDEVHMLSTSAFNALLKTLEEPPAHVIFMMATTEVQKIPSTILSRCQRFDLRRISLTELSRHLKHICELEGINATEKALWLLARQGDGSVRDSLSLLDQVINFSTSFSGGELTEDSVNQILGLTERSLLYDVFEQLLVRNEAGIIDSIQKIALSGTSPSQFLDDYLRLIRHGLLLKCTPEEKIQDLTTIELPKEEITQLFHLISQSNETELHMLFDMAIKLLQDVSRGFDPLIILEVGLLRMVQAPKMQSLQQFFSGAQSAPAPRAMNSAKSSGPTLAAPSAKQTAVAPSRPSIVTQPNQPQVSAQPSQKVLSQTNQKVMAQPIKPSVPKPITAENWLSFVTQMKTFDSYLAAQVENIILAGVTDKKIQFQLSPSFAFLGAQLVHPETKKKLLTAIENFFGESYTFEIGQEKPSTTTTPSVASGESASSLSQKKEALAEEELKESWMKDPKIKKAQELFKGDLKIIKS